MKYEELNVGDVVQLNCPNNWNNFSKEVFAKIIKIMPERAYQLTCLVPPQYGVECTLPLTGRHKNITICNYELLQHNIGIFNPNEMLKITDYKW